MRPKRMIRKDRKPLLLDAALLAAESKGFNKYTRDDVAEFSYCSPTLINAYFTTKIKLDRAVMKLAINRESLTVIADGLIDGDPTARRMTDQDLKSRALDFACNRILKL